MKKIECDCCGIFLTKSQMKIEKIFNDDTLCFCRGIILFDKKIKKLKEELSFVEELLSGAQPEGWDLDLVYKDAFTGRDEHTGEYHKPNKAYAKWLKKRYNLDDIEEEDEE